MDIFPSSVQSLVTSGSHSIAVQKEHMQSILKQGCSVYVQILYCFEPVFIYYYSFINGPSQFWAH